MASFRKVWVAWLVACPLGACAAATGPEAAATAGSHDLFERAAAVRAEGLRHEAERAERAGRFTRALSLYERAEPLIPQDADLRERIADLRDALEREPKASVVDRLERNRNLFRQQAEAEFEEAMAEARRNFRSGDLDGAEAAVRLAAHRVERNRHHLSQTQYRQMRDVIDEVRDRIRQARQVEAARNLARSNRSAGPGGQRGRELRGEREREVQQLVTAARHHQVRLEYEQALLLVQQALALEPQNVGALALRESVRDAMTFRNARALKRLQSRRMAALQTQTLEQAVPQTTLIRYPADWPQLTDVRLRSPEEGFDRSRHTRPGSSEWR